MSLSIFKPPEKNWQPLRTSLQWLCSKGSWDITHKDSVCESVPQSDTRCIRGLIFKNTALSLPYSIPLFPLNISSHAAVVPLRPEIRLIFLSSKPGNQISFYLLVSYSQKTHKASIICLCVWAWEKDTDTDRVIDDNEKERAAIHETTSTLKRLASVVHQCRAELLKPINPVELIFKLLTETSCATKLLCGTPWQLLKHLSDIYKTSCINIYLYEIYVNPNAQNN